MDIHTVTSQIVCLQRQAKDCRPHCQVFKMSFSVCFDSWSGENNINIQLQRLEHLIGIKGTILV